MMLPEPFQEWHYATGHDATERLAALGLEPDDLREALLVGVSASRSITSFHPVTARGYTLWSETVAGLRVRLDEKGWARSDPQNSPRIIAPDGRNAIMVIRGNKETAVSESMVPRTARRRGPATQEAVQVNGQQMLDVTLDVSYSWWDRNPLTWVLLYHWSREEPVVRAELSLPLRISGEGDITQWSHRIVLQPLDLQNAEIDIDPQTGPDDDVDFLITEIQ